MVQCALVLVFSVAFNFSRWFELEYKYVTIEANVTEADSAPPVLRNVTELTIQVGGGTSLHFFSLCKSELTKKVAWAGGHHYTFLSKQNGSQSSTFIGRWVGVIITLFCYAKPSSPRSSYIGRWVGGHHYIIFFKATLPPQVSLCRSN